MHTQEGIGVVKSAFKEFSEDRCAQMAAALAYYTIFSLPPLLVLLISLSGFFLDPQDVRGRLSSEIRSVVGQGGAEAIETMINNADEPKRGVWGTLVGLALLIFGATGVFVQLQEALNRAWDVAPDPDQSGLKALALKRLLSLGMILAIGFLLLVSLVVSALLSGLGDRIASWLPEFFSKWFLQGLNFAISFAVITALFAAIFRILPDAHIEWREVWQGAALTGLLFVLGKTGIGWYLGTKDMASVYGAAGSLVLILIWIYYSSMILLFGAEFTQVWARRHGKQITPSRGAVRVVEQRVHVR